MYLEPEGVTLPKVLSRSNMTNKFRCKTYPIPGCPDVHNRLCGWRSTGPGGSGSDINLPQMPRGLPFMEGDRERLYSKYLKVSSCRTHVPQLHCSGETFERRGRERCIWISSLKICTSMTKKPPKHKTKMVKVKW